MLNCQNSCQDFILSYIACILTADKFAAYAVTVVLCVSRSFFKRSFSDGNILRQPMSTPNINKEFSGSASQRGSKVLSESTPEISTSEADLTFSRFAHSLSSN